MFNLGNYYRWQDELGLDTEIVKAIKMTVPFRSWQQRIEPDFSMLLWALIFQFKQVIQLFQFLSVPFSSFQLLSVAFSSFQFLSAQFQASWFHHWSTVSWSKHCGFDGSQSEILMPFMMVRWSAARQTLVRVLPGSRYAFLVGCRSQLGKSLGRLCLCDLCAFRILQRGTNRSTYLELLTLKVLLNMDQMSWHVVTTFAKRSKRFGVHPHWNPRYPRVHHVLMAFYHLLPSFRSHHGHQRIGPPVPLSSPLFSCSSSGHWRRPASSAVRSVGGYWGLRKQLKHDETISSSGDSKVEVEKRLG